MSEPFDRWLASVFNAGNEPATEAKLQSIELRIGYRLPDEVRRVLALGNRPEGAVGDSYIARSSIARTYLNVGWMHRSAQTASFPSPATAAANGTASIPVRPRLPSF